MRINNALLGIDLYKALKKKNAHDEKTIKEELKQFFEMYGQSMDANEHLFPSLEAIIGRMKERIFGSEFNPFFYKATLDSVRNILAKNKADFSRIAPSIQNVFEDRPKEQMLLDRQIKENIRLISGVNSKMVQDITTVINNQIQRGASQTATMAALKPLLQRSESGYKLIARDQANKFYSSITEARSKANNWQFYRWSTSKDAKVRSKQNTGGYSDHARLDDKIFKFSEPPITVFRGTRAGERNNAGMDIGCRCVAIPLFDPPQAFKKNDDGSYSYKK